MAATPQNIQDFFALIGKTVTNQHLLKFQDALALQRYGKDEDGNPLIPTAADAVDWLYRQARDLANRHTKYTAQQALDVGFIDEVIQHKGKKTAKTSEKRNYVSARYRITTMR